jgi:Tfp pilus assembly protein PilV
MIEALVAVLILGLVVTASLKLAALSTRGLREAREREILLRDGGVIQIRAASDPLNLFGSSGDLNWVVRERSSPIFDEAGIDISKMAFVDEKTDALASARGKEKKWREVEVTRRGKSVTFFLPEPSENVPSGDKL